MKGKKGFTIFSLLAFLPLASAQEVQGIIPLLTDLIGIQVGNPQVAIGVAASFGLMVALVYSVMKIGAEKLEVAESLMGGQYGEGRNVLLIISVLIGLSTLGTGAFGTLVQSFGLISVVLILSIAFVAVFAVGSFGAFGAGGAAKFAGSAGEKLGAKGNELAADAKEKRAESKKRKAEADKKMREMEEEAERIRNDIQEGSEEGDTDSEREAVELEEDIINKVQSIVSDLDLEKDVHFAEQALEDLETELKIGKEEGPKMGYASARINRAHAYLTRLNTEVLSGIGPGSITDPDYVDLLRQTPTVVSGGGMELVILNKSVRADIRSQVGKQNGNGNIDYPPEHDTADPSDIGGIDYSVRDSVGSDFGGFSNETADYGICEALEDVEKARKQFKAVAEGTENEKELEGDAFEDVVNAVEDIKAVHNMIDELHELLGQLEEDNEMLESLAENQNWRDLFEEVESDESAVEDLDDYVQHLNDLQNKAEPILEDVHQTLEQFLDIDEQEIQFLKEDGNLIPEIIIHTTAGNGSGVTGMKDSFSTIESNWSPKPIPPGPAQALQELQNICQNITDECGELTNMLDAIENADKREESEGREMLQELEEIVG